MLSRTRSHDATAARPKQGRLSLFLAAAIAVTWVGAVAAAPAVLHAQAERELQRQRASDGLYYFDGGYEDDGDYVLLGQLPFDDYSRGGVYFLGSSEMNTSIMPWELSAAERRLIHNYSIGDLRHTEQRHYLRMLVEENGLLAAGGERTTIIFALDFPMARTKNGSQYVPGLFARHGLYSYDWESGIHRRRLPEMERLAAIERAVAGRVFQVLLEPSTHVYVTPFTREEKIAHIRRIMSDDWREVMRREVEELAASIDYLLARNVRVRALFVPTGSWQEALGYEAAYREMVMPLLQSRSVGVTDLGDFLHDEEFMDGIHARYSGQRRLHEQTSALAREALREMGIDPGVERLAHVR